MDTAISTSKPASNDFSVRKILEAFSLMSSATILAILFSTLSTKVLSLVAGTSGMALMGIYRNFGALFTGVLTLGFNNVVMHEISVDVTKQKLRELITATLLLFLIQVFIAVTVAILCGSWLTRFTLGHAPTDYDVTCIQIVIVMALVNIALQTTTAILRGQAELRVLTQIQLLTAAATLIMIYPLAKLGPAGFAINVASGGIVSASFASFYILRRNPVTFNFETIRRSFSLLRRTFFSSVIITVQALFTLGALLGSQSLVNRTYGIDPLGNYNAALLVVDTGILVLMSCMRPFFLPALGKARGEQEKMDLCKKITTILLILGILGALFLILASRLVTYLLFSANFQLAGDMLAIFSLSLVGLVLMWTYNTFLIHLGKHGQYAFIDSVWALLIIGGTFLVCQLQLPILSIPFCYVVACSASGFSYAFYVSHKYGRGYFSRTNLMLSIGGLLLLGGMLWLKG